MPFLKRDYKDEEKKVIKNLFFYCVLTFFYIRQIKPIPSFCISKLLNINQLQKRVIYKRHKYTSLTILNYSKVKNQ